MIRYTGLLASLRGSFSSCRPLAGLSLRSVARPLSIKPTSILLNRPFSQSGYNQSVSISCKCQIRNLSFNSSVRSKIPKLNNRNKPLVRIARNFSTNNGVNNFIINFLVKSYLISRTIWSLVPDFLKLIVGFIIASYFLVFVALPILFVGLPILLLGIFLYSKAKAVAGARVSKLYVDYLKTSSLKLGGHEVLSFSNYNNPVKIHKLHSIISRRVALAFEYNENNIEKNFKVSQGNGKFIDNRPFESKVRLSNVFTIKLESLNSGSISADTAVNNEIPYDSLMIYEFFLLESDYSSPNDFRKKTAQVNVIIGNPKSSISDQLDDRVFEELFQTRFDNNDEKISQPFIIELVPTGLNFNRFIISSPSDFDTGSSDTIITINKHKTKTYD
ncbi:hypothetical protein DASC09_033350 [Saccharomycopsis crataegensis]|uniref:Uncharacterized protein n=1 Tax=Saccharomycopsis crataegensis TaxID=43959 RepID=A0AAV5QM24_9ASCO|nr:hypothetical protein DASC09_033350 [Saccharomycopsis crataegensis]